MESSTMCTAPLTAYRPRKRNENGKAPLVFSVKEGHKDQTVQIKCGQCIECKMEHARQWAIRCMCEQQITEEKGKRSCFATFTYNEENVPYVESESMEGVYHQTLFKRDMQLYIKRVRKKGYKFRYFCAGEYGGRFERPHYHAIIFGYVPTGLQLVDISDSGYNVYNSDEMDEDWTHGLTYVQELCFETAFYCAGYALKKLSGKGEYFEKKYGVKDASEYYDGKQPEFVTMSRRPGIGAEFYDKYRKDMYPKDRLKMNNVEMLPPRFFYEREKRNGQLENLQKGKWNKATSRLSPTDIERAKAKRVKKLEDLPEEIKSKRLDQARKRAFTQKIKEYRYEQRKQRTAVCNGGKSIHDLRPDLRIVQREPDRGKSTDKSNKSVAARSDEHSESSSHICT